MASTNVSGNRVVADITNNLTRLSHGDIVHRMFQNTVEEAMHSRLWHEETRLREINERLRELTKAYNEYVDLKNEAKGRRERLEILFALVGGLDLNKARETGEDSEHQTAQQVLSVSQEEIRATLPLWKAMQEFLSYVPEARIGEMETFFESVDYADGNRQAIESALKRHPDIFKIRKQKREKYISLK